MAVPPLRAIIVVGYNILRVSCRKCGLYLLVGIMLLILHSFVSNESHNGDAVKTRQSNDLVFENELALLESEVYLSAANTPTDSIETVSGISSGSCSALNKEANSAVRRATTEYCRERIRNISCEIEKGTFYPDRLVSSCPTNGQVRGRFVGCFVDSRNDRLLRGHVSQQKKNSPLVCTDFCFTRGYVYAGLQYGKECFCGNEKLSPDHVTSPDSCDMVCEGNSRYMCGGYLTMSIYQTGLSKQTNTDALVGDVSDGVVRIAYILTLNGRAVRQMYRLFRALYQSHHYFYIHVDKRSEYMYRAAVTLSQKYNNVHVTAVRHSTIWGGTSLLTVLLQAMRDLLKKEDWHWDFVINLSESDYPIKNNSALESFLSWNRGRNFLKSHGQDTNRFLHKQGLDRTFLECENHMWRLGDRSLPKGVRVDGGSDWVCLGREFVTYVVTTKDTLVRGLLKVYQHTLLPAESFFHTVMRNSVHCGSFTDNNLHLTNWRRKLGCRCQYKHIVDWCGCSPNDFLPKDWNKLLSTRSRNLFFARKFEAIVNQGIINKLDAWLYGSYRNDTPSLHNYWENRYHHLDSAGTTKDPLMSLYLSGARLGAAKVSRKGCDVRLHHLLQVNSLHAADSFKGIIVQSVATVEGQSFFLENWLIPHHTSPALIHLPEEVLDVQIGSYFDLKEQLFRNFERALGPTSDITIALRLPKAKQKEDDDVMKSFTVVLVDPADIITNVSVLDDDSQDVYLSQVLSPPKPLRPGKWTAYVILEGKLCAERRFTVLPTMHLAGVEMEESDERHLNCGPPSEAPLSSFLPPVDDYLHSLPLSVQKVNRTAAANKWRDGHCHLSRDRTVLLLDQIVKSSWTVSSACYVAESYVPVCVSDTLTQCHSAPWSSHYPDPKGTLSPTDPRTGRMVDLHRDTR